LRRHRGRILAFILAVLAILWGLLSLAAFNPDASGNAPLIAFGVAQLVYGAVVLLILIKNGAEFSRPRV
jgi:hypothetical protein